MISVAHYKHFRAGKGHRNNLKLILNVVNEVLLWKGQTKQLNCPVRIDI